MHADGIPVNQKNWSWEHIRQREQQGRWLLWSKVISPDITKYIWTFDRGTLLNFQVRYVVILVTDSFFYKLKGMDRHRRGKSNFESSSTTVVEFGIYWVAANSSSRLYYKPELWLPSVLATNQMWLLNTEYDWGTEFFMLFNFN